MARLCARREGHQGDHKFRQARGHCPTTVSDWLPSRGARPESLFRVTKVSTYLGLGSALYHSTPWPRAVTPLSTTESVEAWKTSFLKEAS